MPSSKNMLTILQHKSSSYTPRTYKNGVDVEHTEDEIRVHVAQGVALLRLA